MIYESSKNYLNNTLTLVFDGNVAPTEDEIRDYCKRNYGVNGLFEFYIDLPREGYGGYQNEGIVKVQLPYNDA
jgi:hypothetical protein